MKTGIIYIQTILLILCYYFILQLRNALNDQTRVMREMLGLNKICQQQYERLYTIAKRKDSIINIYQREVRFVQETTKRTLRTIDLSTSTTEKAIQNGQANFKALREANQRLAEVGLDPVRIRY